MKVDIKDWKDFKFGTLIDQIYKAKAHTDDELEFAEFPTKETIPYVTRTDLNNGVKAFVYRNGIDSIEKGNALVIGDTTATISYQREEFVTGDHIVIVRAPWLNMFTGLFIVSILKLEQYRYSYGRAFTMDLILNTYVKLPARIDGKPNWKFIENFMGGLHTNPITTSNRSSHKPLETNKWKRFRVVDLFTVEKGKRLTADDQTEGDTIYIGAIDSNNGVAAHIGQSPMHKGNTISLSYNGSVGEAFYQPDPFWATDDVNVLYFKPSNHHKFNQYIGLFIATLLKQEKYRFSYGRKWVLKEMEDTVLRLPVDPAGNPDWDFMENYIKSLPYGDRLTT